MTKATGEGLTATYTYDADGLRLTKTVGGVEHKYLWQGSKLVSEYYDGKELEFFYDESGNPYAFSYKSGSTATPVTYYYLTNLQGDITGVLDTSGTTVATYTYNAWGKLLSSSGDMASINPLRYRGYYYDAELEMYYLKSRYYDPEICRFISADGYASTGQGVIGTNMFVYCNNNPGNSVDNDGLTTVGFGFDLSAGFGIRAGVSVQIVVDDDENVGILVTYSGGGGTPSAALSLIESVTNADTIEDLQGAGGAFGASSSVGGDVTVGNARNGDVVCGVQSSQALLSTPVPLEAHGEATYSVLYLPDRLPKLLKMLIENELIKQLNKMT